MLTYAGIDKIETDKENISYKVYLETLSRGDPHRYEKHQFNLGKIENKESGDIYVVIYREDGYDSICQPMFVSGDKSDALEKMLNMAQGLAVDLINHTKKVHIIRERYTGVNTPFPLDASIK